MSLRNKPVEKNIDSGNRQQSARQNANDKKQANDPDQLAKEAEQERTRKPGSQSNSSGRHNNGRGGGK